MKMPEVSASGVKWSKLIKLTKDSLSDYWLSNCLVTRVVASIGSKSTSAVYDLAIYLSKTLLMPLVHLGSLHIFILIVSKNET